jgi:fucose permease
VLNAITGVVQVLPVRSRPTGIAVGSAGLFLGMVVALGMGAALAGGDRVETLMVAQAVVALIAVVAYLVVAARAPRPAAVASTEEGQLRAVWRDPVLRRIALLAFLGFGVFVALVTWLQALLDPRGVSESSAGTVVTVAVAVGAIGSTVVAAALEGRPVEAVLVRTTLVAAVLGCLVLAVGSGLASAWVGVVIAVLAMLTALPWLLALCERNARDAVASATALLWLAGNLGGLVVAGMLGLLLDHPGAAFALLAVVALAGLPLVRADAIGAGVREARPVADG